MKKNKMMRIASVLLIVTLLSTCAISGTFAKYVTKATGEDAARVAKWGITIDVEGDGMFSDVYAADDEGYITALAAYPNLSENTVESANGDDVVAPGTTSKKVVDGEEVHAFKATVSGKPEVATRFSLKLCDLVDIFMPAGEGYADYTTAVSDEETFDLVYGDTGLNNPYIFGYAPVKWDVTVTKTTTGTTANLTSIAREVAQSYANESLKNLCDQLFTDSGVSITDAMTIVDEVESRGMAAELVEKISNKFRSLKIGNLQLSIENGEVIVSMDFSPNQEVNYEFTLDWTWDFEQQAPASVTDEDERAAFTNMFNKADTYIGNVAAGVIDDDTVSTDLGFTFIASATQID